jgi:hypothetical protein
MINDQTMITSINFKFSFIFFFFFLESMFSLNGQILRIYRRFAHANVPSMLIKLLLVTYMNVILLHRTRLGTAPM